MAQASSIEKEDVPEEFLRFYELIVGEKLGFGGFGTVFEATDNTNQRVAIKVLERKGHVERESIPYGYSHENVIEVKAVWRNPVEYHCYDSCLVMQRCDTSLHDYMLRQKETLDVSTQHKLKTDIMKGLQFLHENRIVHRDVKPNNILIMLGNGFIKKAKLADFGLAKELSEGISYMASVLGSDRWMAPEVLKGNKYRKKVDIWSSGKVFLYISLDRNSRHSIAQQKCGEKRQHKAIDGHERDIDDPRSIHLIRDMMMTTASQRPEASEIIERLKKDGADAAKTDAMAGRSVPMVSMADAADAAKTDAMAGRSVPMVLMTDAADAAKTDAMAGRSVPNVSMADAADAAKTDAAIEDTGLDNIGIEDLPRQLLQDCRLIPERRLGHGRFGTVFEALWDQKKGDSNQREMRRSNQIKVAIKVMQANKYVKAELIPKDCDHPNVIEILHVWYNHDKNQRFHLCIIMPLCNMSLLDYMGLEPAVLKVEQQHKLKTDIMSGLEYLHNHKKHIIHRDVKPCNILICDDGPHAKLADFGLSKQLGLGKSYMDSLLGTPTYMAPEVLLGIPYKDVIDIWSSGKVFLFISIGPANRKAIETQNCGFAEVREHKAIKENGSEIHNKRSRRLIMHMMMKDPLERPSAREVLQRLQNKDGSTGSNPSDQGPSPHLRYLNEDLSRQPNLSQPSPGTIIGSFAESDSNSSSYEDYQQNIPRDFLPQDSSNRSISYPRIVVTGGAALHPQTANIVPNTDMFCLTNQGEWIPKSDFDLKTALPLIAPIDRGFAALGGYAYGNQMMTTQIYNVNRSQNSVSGIRVSSAKLHAISYCRHAGLVESQGVLYVIGGVNENETVTTEVKKVNLMTADSQWVPCQPCPLPITWPIVTSGEGLIYIIKNTCAYNQQIRISQTPIKMYMYNTGNDRWRESTQLRQDILSTAGASLIFNEGFLYLLGGEGRLCERFSTEYRGWEPIPEKPLLPHGFAPCVIQQDRVFLLGGYGSQGTIEEFSLVTGKWTVWDVRMPKELVYHSATIV